MNEKKATRWGAIIAFFTAVVALVSALVAFNHMLNEQQEKTDQQRVEDQRQRDRDREEFQRQRVLQQRQIADASAAQQRLQLCSRHQENARVIDTDFDRLYREHGQLLSAMQSCAKEKPDNQASCGVTVCALAAFWTGGESNCIDVASRVDAMKQRALAEKKLATADSCQIGESVVVTYFN